MTDAREGEILVYGLPSLWGAPSPSPFIIKLLTWLRMAELPHRLVALGGPPRSKTGKVPYVDLPDGRQLTDSGAIIETLGRERGIDLDTHLDEEARARAHFVRRALEEHLYFVGLYERFLHPPGFAHTRKGYFRHMPWLVQVIMPLILRRRVRAMLHGQGLGRRTYPEICAAAAEDLRSLSLVLGERPFFGGEQPATIDATVTGCLWAFTSNPFPCSVGDQSRAHANLMAYLERMKGRYWADWEGGGQGGPGA